MTKKPFAGVFEEPPLDLDIDDAPARSKEVQAALEKQRDPLTFNLQSANDPTVLLGNRYLNRGDGAILSSTSGMGKSSMSGQMAGQWALGHDFHGIKPNGPLKSLIIQSEDSDGDIAEVWQSLAHVGQWNEEQRAQISRNVRIVSNRTDRGDKFIGALKNHLEAFKPDLVWINPLQAFIDGDVTDSKDIGYFLRESLNGLNAESGFGYILVHHTTKPPTAKDRGARAWHEVMYDMAGGAELINWARAILSLRAADEEGKFKLVLAKRGRRAGVVKEVEQGAGMRFEPVTELGLQHRRGEFLPNTNTPVIYWDACEIAAPEKSTPKNGGRKTQFDFKDYRAVFPAKSTKGQTLAELHRTLQVNGDVKKGSLPALCQRWSEEGFVEILDNPDGRRYRSAV